jgi:peptidoglycan lytic transglycosylase
VLVVTFRARAPSRYLRSPSSTSGIARRMSRNRRSLTMFAWVAASMTFTGCAQLQHSPGSEAVSSPPEETSTAAPSSAPRAPPVEPDTAVASRQRGRISLYGNAFAGKPTASGDTFDPERLTMAHRTLPFGTRVRVTNLANQRSVEVVVNDRGPFVPGRIADLSAAAARQIGMVVDGVVDALLEILRPAKTR